MPSLSTTVSKVMKVCNEPDTSANDLNRVISLDPVLTGRVLKLINSAYYSLPGQVTSLTRAIIMLGQNTVKNLVLSTAVLGIIGRERHAFFPMGQFWSHSFGAAIMAKSIAALRGIDLGNQEEYFVAGLLHDLGKLPISKCFKNEYKQVLELVYLQRCSLLRAEEMVLGFTHQDSGRMLAEKWEFHPRMAVCLSNHHDLFFEEEGQYSELLKVVAVANLFTNVFEIGSAGDDIQEVVDVQNILARSGVRWNDLSPFILRVPQEIESARSFLDIVI
ncbi:MAG: HDOD domain-containing protein [Thermodesulfobacteriota bacterium]